MPTEPPPTRWVFPDPGEFDEGDDMIALGADLQPGTILSAYQQGIFPMPLSELPEMSWWSPSPRAILPLDGLRVTRSMRQSAKRYSATVDQAFDAVVAACADPARPGGWISGPIAGAYQGLHQLGWAHSVEVWQDDTLVGGLYGIAIGGLFAGESMFHHARDASKVALMTLVELLDDGQAERLLDVQWATSHLRSLGVIEVARVEYLASLRRALGVALPEPWR